MNKPPAVNTSANNLDKTIQNWVELDNELKRVNEKAKDIRTRKNDIEDKLMTYVEDNNMNKLVYLVPLFPLIGFLINGLGRKSLSKSLIGIIGSTTILASFVVSVFLFMDVKAHGASVVSAFNFICDDHNPFFKSLTDEK